MADIADKFGKASIDTDYAIATTVKTTRVPGATVLEAFDLSKFTDDTPVFFVTYKKTTDPVTNVTSVTNLVSWKGLVNTGANTVTNLTLAPGYADTGNAIGDFVECIPTSHWVNSLIDGLFVSHNPDGTLKDKAATLPKINGGSTAGVLTTDASGNVTVGAKTTDANGWTVYNYGTWKEYVKKTANGAANKVQYEAWDLITETLPVGVVATDLKEVQVTPVYIDYTEFMGNINIRHTTTTNIVLRAASFRSGATPYQYAFYIKLKV